MFSLSIKDEIKKLEAKAKYYILDRQTGKTFFVFDDEFFKNGQICKRGSFVKKNGDRADIEEGYLFNSMIDQGLKANPPRYDFTKDFIDAYNHCVKK